MQTKLAYQLTNPHNAKERCEMVSTGRSFLFKQIMMKNVCYGLMKESSIIQLFNTTFLGNDYNSKWQ